MTTSVTATLGVTSADRLIAIRENKLADANFLLTSLIGKCFKESEQICLVILHNTLGHYQNVGKRLGYNLLHEIKEKRAQIIEPFKWIAEDINRISDKTIAKQIIVDIQQTLVELQKSCSPITVFIDDVSHLLDLGVELKDVLRFVKYCHSLLRNGQVSLVVNCHVATKTDEIVSNMLFYAADLALVVSALKTGRSKHVSGVLTVHRQCSKTLVKHVYQFKLTDSDIQLFRPAHSLF